MEEIPPPPLEVLSAAIRCGRRLVTQIDRDLAVRGLTWSQYQALAVFDRHNGWIHAGAVGRRMGVSRQAAHTLLHRLGGRGFLEWDERQAWVRCARITLDGREALAAGREALTDVFAAMERLTVEERKQVVSTDNSIRRELARPPGWKPWTPWVPAAVEVRDNSGEAGPRRSNTSRA
jgi:DNA-binding MarR family transcriptional regulator